MSIKKSVRLVDKTHALCVLLGDTGTINWSGALNRMAERYDYVVSTSMPELSKYEKLAICALYNGHMQRDIASELKSMEFIIYEGIKYDGNFVDLLKQGNVDLEGFKRKVESFSMIERMAVLDMTEKFWNHTHIKQQRLEEIASKLDSLKNIDGLC